MKTTDIRKLHKVLILFPIIVFLLNGCRESVEDGLPGKASNTSANSTYHPTGWKDNPQHGIDYPANPQNCKACHGDDLAGSIAAVSCSPCHHEEAVAPWQHGDYHTVPDDCTSCHGGDFTGGNTLVSCFSCHGAISAFDCTDCHTGPASSYTDSAHGNSSYGVDRSGTGYAQGGCTQCHDLPAGSTNGLLLFSAVNPTSQSENFCFQCHKGPADSVQTAMPNQYSYSYRASGDTNLTTPDDVLEAFTFSTPATSHKLSDISTFIDGKWGYTADSNPCTACHNPHSAERDSHTDGNRGWPVSLPSDHTDTSTWGLWGDELGEKMDQYTTSYQAPNADSGYEPDGSDTTDGSNLTDYVTFCTDCHNSTNTIYSNVLDRYLKTIDWDNEKHGKGDAEGYIMVDSPYTAGSGSLGYVLSCLDCHEPHGSQNVTLIRNYVNGGQLASNVTSLNSTDCTPPYTDHDDNIKNLCIRCHNDNLDNIHHNTTNNDACYERHQCNDCHEDGAGDPVNCSCCHYHGSSKTDCDHSPATRITF